MDIFLFGKRLSVPAGRSIALYDVVDFRKYVKRKLNDMSDDNGYHFFVSGDRLDEICLTLIGISLEKNWDIPIADQQQREQTFRTQLEKCFKVSLNSVFRMPYGIIGQMGNVDIQMAEIRIVDGYLVMVY